MGHPSSNVAAPGANPVSVGATSGVLAWSVQFSLFAFLVALAWRIFGLEPQTAFENHLVSAAVGVMFALSASLWIVSGRWSRLSKAAGVFACLLAPVIAEWNSAREFDSSIRILDPAREIDGRIVHEAIGLSYVRLPDSQVDLQPRFTGNQSAKSNSLSKGLSRLGHGSSAILSRVTLPSRSENSSGIPSMILLEVEHRRGRVLNRFLRDIKAREIAIAAYPNLRILRAAHASKIAGIDMIEFEFVEERQHLTSRQAHFQSGRFIVSFVFNCANDSDRPVFDAFLKSIRLEPWALPLEIHSGTEHQRAVVNHATRSTND